MSVVIIGNGDEARRAINAFEQASVNWTPAQRAIGEAMLRDYTRRMLDYIRKAQDVNR